MNQRPENGFHGYVMHEACWMLLEKFFTLRPVALDCLFQLCVSLPFPRYGGVTWSHKYVGFAFQDDESNILGRIASRFMERARKFMLTPRSTRTMYQL